MTSTTRVQLGVAAVLPLLFGVFAAAISFQLDRVAAHSLVADISWLWLASALLGSFLVVPAIVLLVVGGFMIRRLPQFGTTVAAFALATTALVCLFAMVGGAVYGLGDPTPPSADVGGGDKLPRLSIAGVALYVVPYCPLIAANVYAIRSLFSDLTEEAKGRIPARQQSEGAGP